MYLLAIPVLLVLELAVLVERRAHEVLYAARRGASRWPTEPVDAPRGASAPISFGPGMPPTEGASPPRRPVRWLGWGLAVAILVGCLLFIDPGEIAAALRRLSPRELALLLLLASLDRI